MSNAAGGRESLRRFSTARIVEHLALIALFLVLAATGLAQKFHHFELSQWLLSAAGGVDRARQLHHWAGAVLAALIAVHVVTAWVGIFAFRRSFAMLVTPQDFRNAVQDLRYHLAQRERPAACDRYDYKQKFTYWMILISCALMALTGLALWFPVTVARFLPGEAIPLAATLHSHQALVILLVVVVWHVYDSVLNPDVFPLDTSIFTGRMSRMRMRRLHPRELDRLERGSSESVGGGGAPAG